MTAVENIKEDIKTKVEDTNKRNMCLFIINYLSRDKVENLNMITFSGLARAIGQEKVTSELVEAAYLLSGPTFSVLKPGFLLIDDTGEEHELSTQEISKGRKTGYIVHPDNGKKIYEYEGMVVPFFEVDETIAGEIVDS